VLGKRFPKIFLKMFSEFTFFLQMFLRCGIWLRFS